jgi:hypothetical protein
MRAPDFETEAALCAAFIAWIQKNAECGRSGFEGAKCYSEWCGWDILLVLEDGAQVGIQAKLRLNADVIGQAMQGVNDHWFVDDGPDYRAVLVPVSRGPLKELAALLGLVVFYPESYFARLGPGAFHPGLDSGWRRLMVDWNPDRRLKLPPVATDSVAGEPCPVSLTDWKLGALAVLAELEVKGAITTKRMQELKVSPSRWLSGRWLVPVSGARGLWVRGDKCPTFDLQHPTAFAAALLKARQ